MQSLESLPLKWRAIVESIHCICHTGVLCNGFIFYQKTPSTDDVNVHFVAVPKLDRLVEVFTCIIIILYIKIYV